MPRITTAHQEAEPRECSYTVYYQPLARVRKVRRNGRAVRIARNPSHAGYQVTVPLLPGLVTYGRTLAEARAMARDAIRCHLEGLRKDGEPAPDERGARKERLRVAVLA